MFATPVGNPEHSDVLLLSGSLEYVIIQKDFILKLKLLCETLKNVKFLFDIEI